MIENLVPDRDKYLLYKGRHEMHGADRVGRRAAQIMPKCGQERWSPG